VGAAIFAVIGRVGGSSRALQHVRLQLVARLGILIAWLLALCGPHGGGCFVRHRRADERQHLFRW